MGGWVDFWDYVRVLAGVRGRHRKNRIVVAHMGDVIDGNHHGTKQIIQDVNDQYLVALDVLRPIFDMADASFGILGTEAHAGSAGENEVSLYRELQATDYGQVLNLEIDGKLHDLAHHGRVGSRPWTSSAAAIAVEVCLDCGIQGIPFPDYIWRAHRHIIDDSGLKVPGTRCLTTPSWQLFTSFVYGVAPNTRRSDIGGFIVDGGVLDDSRCRYKAQPDARKVIHV